jgi:nucleoid-associated protein YgaU
MSVPAEWMPDAVMKRIICHWTAGAYKASPLDRMHYHILIEDDGELVRGFHSISDNERTDDGVYAAHTWRLNTGSIGVAVCCMAESEEVPFDSGRFPMTEVQWEQMADVVAELCDRYSIPVTDETVLGHGEVQRRLGLAQRGKWDPMVLPWRPNLPREKVGSLFRIKVLAALDRIHNAQGAPAAPQTSEEAPAVSVRAFLNGGVLPGSVLINEGAYIKLSSLMAVGWKVTSAFPDRVILRDDKGWEHKLAHTLLNDELDARLSGERLRDKLVDDGCLSAIDVARACVLPITYDPNTDTIAIGSAAVPERPAAPDFASTRTAVVVHAGDTLYTIAERYLGNGNRWTALMRKDGRLFTPAETRRLAVGQVILLPQAPRSQRIRTSRISNVSAIRVGFPDIAVDTLVDAARPELRNFAQHSIPVILTECAAAGVRDAGQIAYVLATADHESNCGKYMRELGDRMSFQKYEFKRSLGNTVAGDGFRFRGRGFVQLTGRANYAKWSMELGVDLLDDPDLVAEPAVAAKILVKGMIAGSFTTRRLGDYVEGEHRDFYNARAVVNGDKAKNGERIAAYARRYLTGLVSRVSPVETISSVIGFNEGMVTGATAGIEFVHA